MSQGGALVWFVVTCEHLPPVRWEGAPLQVCPHKTALLFTRNNLSQRAGANEAKPVLPRYDVASCFVTTPLFGAGCNVCASAWQVCQFLPALIQTV